VTIRGRPVGLLPGCPTSGGTITTASLLSTKTLIEGKVVILGGAVTNLDNGYAGGIVSAVQAAGVLIG
jgi:hypothetical protein